MRRTRTRFDGDPYQAFAAGIALADIADSDAVPGPDGAVDSGDLTLFFLSFSEQTSP